MRAQTSFNYLAYKIAMATRNMMRIREDLSSAEVVLGNWAVLSILLLYQSRTFSTELFCTVALHWSLARSKLTKFWNVCNRVFGMGQTEQPDDWGTARRLGMDQTKYTYDRVWARQNRPNSGTGQTERRDRNFVQTISSVAPDPSVRDPGPSGPYFILGPHIVI